jgi:hypothetical protein
MVILMPIEKEKLSAFFFTYFTDAQCVFWGFVKDTVFMPPLPAISRISATLSPLLWLGSTVIR